MNNENAGWIKHAQAQENKVPVWLVRIFEHPMFLSLQRQLDGSWWIVTAEEKDFDARTLDEVCQRFTIHYNSE